MLLTPPRPLAIRSTVRAEQWWISTAAALLCLLQLLAIDQRNPLTRTLSSYEYTPWGWMFPVSLAIFGVGIMLLAVRMDHTVRLARWLLAGAAVASWMTAAFPSGDSTSGGYWPGEVHRWGSIALMALVLAAALALLRRGIPAETRSAVVRLVVVGAAAGLAFLAGQALKPAAAPIVGQAPLAGGLTQRILVAVVAGILLLIAAGTSRAATRALGPVVPPAGGAMHRGARSGPSHPAQSAGRVVDGASPRRYRAATAAEARQITAVVPNAAGNPKASASAPATSGPTMEPTSPITW